MNATRPSTSAPTACPSSRSKFPAPRAAATAAARGSLFRDPLFTIASHCSPIANSAQIAQKRAVKFVKNGGQKKFAGALKFFCPPFIMKLQSKIGSCKEVFRTRAATITRLARQSVSDEDLKHFLLWQHRAIAPARFGGSFPPILWFDEKSLAESACRIAWCCLISGR